MSIYNTILEWSQQSGRPMWWRDALRRLVTNPTFADSDIDELVEMCGQSVGFAPGPNAVPAKALTVTDLPTAIDEREAVQLVSISNVVNVNALAGEQVLPFAATGMTVIYGDNGAGKSGYTRILKKCCRSRGQDIPIEKNARTGATDTPSATVTYRVGNRDVRFDWQSGAVRPQVLGAISIFDSSAANFYVREKASTAYVPSGADLLPRLVLVCDRVRDRVKAELDGENRQPPKWNSVSPETTAGKFLASLTAKTSPEAVLRAVAFSEQDEKRLQVLRSQSATLKLGGPLVKAKQLEAHALRVRALAGQAKTVDDVLNDKSIENLCATKEQVRLSSAAADLARNLAFEGAALEGVGSDVWRTLWAAAAEYSTKAAYVDEAFPVTTAKGALCVLCHQALSPEAAARLVAFEKFVNDAASVQKAKHIGEWNRAMTAIRSLSIPEADALSVVELEAAFSGSTKDLISYLEATRARREALEKGDAELQPIGFSPSPSLIELAERMEAEALALRATIVPSVQVTLDSELRELEARFSLSKLSSEIADEVKRLKRIFCYERALRETNTTEITRLSTRILETSVAGVVAATFKEEIRSLRVSLAAEYEPLNGAKGALHHQMSIGGSISVDRIASEGEHRALALATFLAELSIAPQGSAIVFDDPMASLDHKRREIVARRFAQESLRRQVIIFTHDVVFLLLLQEQAAKCGAAMSCHYVQTQGGVPGVCQEGLPWVVSSTEKRIKALRNEANSRIRPAHSKVTDEEYESMVRAFYGRLRRTWERAIEEKLLGGVVERFGRGIHTQQLKGVDVLDTDVEIVECNMGKCSAIFEGHDEAAAVRSPIPEPMEVDADLEALDGWLKAIRDRRA